MHALSRTLSLGCAALLSLVTLPSTSLNAQEDGPPNVLVVQREYLKPGKGGLLHERSESAFVRASAEAKSSLHYFALDSMSGPSRSLFMFSYDSFAAWEKENAAMRRNGVLAAAIDHATLMDGDLLASYDASAGMLRPDLSLNRGHLEGARYFEITTLVVKPGHVQEFEELAHLYADSFRKVDPESHWDCFEMMYGSPIAGVAAGSTFVVITTMKSLAEVDTEMQDYKKMAGVLGESGIKRAGELNAASIETQTTNLFEINPRMSYPRQEWIDREPAFWKATPSPAMKKNMAKAEKP